MLKDKIVVITGGAGRLGSEFAKTVAENGGYALMADVDEAAGGKTALRLNELFGRQCAEFFKTDISSKECINSLISHLHGKFGRIDALVNSAYPRNKNYGRHFFNVEYSDFCENLSANLGGYFLSSQQFAEYFRSQGYGNIINISSVYGVVAPRFEIYENTPMTMPVEYAAIKSGLLLMTRYMAKYFKGMNIRVNAISPGGILDGQPEAFLESYKNQCTNKGMLDKTDINGTLLYLLSDLSRFVNGQNIIVDDGFSL